LLDEAEARISQALDEARAYLASPEGRELRRRVAQAMILAAPLAFRLPVFRRTPAGRLLGLLGGAAVVVKLAEILRDWEPEPTLTVPAE
jgi:hypothetical protein